MNWPVVILAAMSPISSLFIAALLLQRKAMLEEITWAKDELQYWKKLRHAEKKRDPEDAVVQGWMEYD